MRVVGNRRGVVSFIDKPMVWHHGVFRKAKGFSWLEIERSGAFSGGIVAHIPVDQRRRTCLEGNMETLRSGMGHGTSKKKVK